MNTNIEKLAFRADLLRESIRSHGLSQRKVANIMNINEKTFSQKMNGISDWTLREIQTLGAILAPLDIKTIFHF